MRNAARTITFFFDTFNHLINNGKQIVLAADVPPLELGMEERVTSRLDGGFSVSIQVPSYELKYTLISSFYKRMKEEGVKDYEGEISEDCLKYMAEVSGTNIRLIKAFCQSCLYMATKCERNGSDFDQSMVKGLAKQRWSLKQRMVTVEEIQQKVEEFFSISHNDLIGSKRNKEIMEPRHIAIWLTRTLTDDTLAEIGKKFGGRSHATIKHSVSWVDQEMHENHLFFDRIERLKEELSEME
jgi:chromosomal replication initiator protein